MELHFPYSLVHLFIFCGISLRSGRLLNENELDSLGWRTHVALQRGPHLIMDVVLEILQLKCFIFVNKCWTF